MWRAEGHKFDPVRFSPFEPAEMLYEFDGPRIFTLNDADGELNLAYWSDQSGDRDRYLVVPTTASTIDLLREGGMSVGDALAQARCWVCDVDHDGRLVECLRVQFDTIPKDALPAAGTMLLPTLEPLLTLRAVGVDIVRGRVPSSVVKNCIEGVQKTFKLLAEYVLEQPAQAGRPKDFIRRLFDLPTQRIATGSLEVSFRMPIEEQSLFAGGAKSSEVQTLEEVGILLKKGLSWLATAAAEEGVFGGDNEVVLRALKEITPSSQGSIDRLELRGQIIGPRTTPFVLDRTSRQRVNTAIRNRAFEPKVIDLQGRIRELDKDRMSFELRELDGDKPPQRFVFDEELLEDVFQALQDNARVRVAGRTYPVRNLAYALALSRL
jgi:hypothetical protein